MNLVFKDNLKKLRKDFSMSQEDLAEKLGVSRQSVSKWETGDAYPEMDKIITIANLFNVNIDELLNKNIDEVKENKLKNNNINNFTNSFFDFITKTVNMFSKMSFGSKFKCFFEIFFIYLFLYLGFSILGSIILSILFGSFSNSYILFIRDIFSIIFNLLSFGLALIIVFHIFNIRYLKYFDDVDSGEKVSKKINKIEKNEEVKMESKNIKNNKVEEKVIIRDPKDSEYSFINTLFKVFLTFIKIIVGLFGIGFIISLITFVILFVISFSIIKSGLFFVGLLLMIISLIVANVVVLILIYNFLFNKKNNFVVSGVIILTSIIVFSTGAGSILFSLKDFNFINGNQVTTEVFPMNNNFNFYNTLDSDVLYLEENRDDVKIEFSHSKLVNIDIQMKDQATVLFKVNNININEALNYQISEFNKKNIINYYDSKIIVYANKNNLDIIKKNNFITYGDDDHFNRY